MVPSVFQRCRTIREVGTIDLVNRCGSSRRKAAILSDERHCPLENELVNWRFVQVVFREYSTMIERTSGIEEPLLTDHQK